MPDLVSPPSAITVTGHFFNTEAAMAIRVSGGSSWENLAVTFVSDTQLTATFPPKDAQTVVDIRVTVGGKSTIKIRGYTYPR